MPMNDLKNNTIAAAVARMPGGASDCATAYDGPKNTKLKQTRQHERGRHRRARGEVAHELHGDDDERGERADPQCPTRFATTRAQAIGQRSAEIRSRHAARAHQGNQRSDLAAVPAVRAREIGWVEAGRTVHRDRMQRASRAQVAKRGDRCEVRQRRRERRTFAHRWRWPRGLRDQEQQRHEHESRRAGEQHRAAPSEVLAAPSTDESSEHRARRRAERVDPERRRASFRGKVVRDQ